MGWRERDWARFDMSERKVLYGTATRGGRTTRAALARRLITVAVLAAAAAVAVGQLPRSHPLVPAFAFNLPHLGTSAASRLVASSLGQSREIPLRGSNSTRYGATYTITGTTGTVNGMHVTGAVILRGRWNGGHWTRLAVNKTDSAGRFRVSVKLRRRGVLELRLTMPDGFVGTKTLRVT